MRWLEIRNTGVSILDVLEAISEGLGIESILVRFPGLLASDIAESAAVVRFFLIRSGSKPVPSAPPRAGNYHSVRRQLKKGHWSKDEESELVKLISCGASPDNAARILMRMRADVYIKLEGLKNVEHYLGRRRND
ncbi:MAG: hypothetical protein JSV52_13040 [Candidatus Zixiibacteriota bacterium]|nr:MAG: hypothetical protein JSV52_13040 [candidate division Zixibacteria bacterium]